VNFYNQNCAAIFYAKWSQAYSAPFSCSQTTLTLSATSSAISFKTAYNTSVINIYIPPIDISYGGGCFAGSETVQLQSGEAISISQVRVGDRLLAADRRGLTHFAAVVAVPHQQNSRPAVFSFITTDGGNDIKLTPNHLLLSGPCGSALSLTFAETVAPGSCILTTTGQESVSTNIKVVSSEGLYTIITEAELVVVNKVVASPFADNHAVTHAFYSTLRLLSALFPTALSLLGSKVVRAAVEAFGGLTTAASW